jgi:hypothetical protein
MSANVGKKTLNKYNGLFKLVLKTMLVWADLIYFLDAFF